MAWTNKVPTTTGWKYWRRNQADQFTPIEVYLDFIGSLRSCGVDTRGGLWWDAPVPAPGESFSVREVTDWLIYCYQNQLGRLPEDPKDGIITITKKLKEGKIHLRLSDQW